MRHPELSSDSGPGLVGGALIVVVAGGATVGAAQSSNTASILAFVGAVLVALVTWYATDRRQHAALMAEERRQRAVFDNEAQRQARELEHRDHRDDRQHFREFLDEVARVYEAAMDDYTSVSVAFEMHPNDSAQRVTESLAAHRATEAMQLLARRMHFRLPADHPITVAVNNGAQAMALAVNALPPLDAVPASFDAGEVTTVLDDAGVQMMNNLRELSVAARALIGIESAFSSET